MDVHYLASSNFTLRLSRVRLRVLRRVASLLGRALRSGKPSGKLECEPGEQEWSAPSDDKDSSHTTPRPSNATTISPSSSCSSFSHNALQPQLLLALYKGGGGGSRAALQQGHSTDRQEPGQQPQWTPPTLRELEEYLLT
ncbi:hypothetical protein AGOR_G00012080 [Albula goreensis]|uniref:Uncharacterized protein n=1 Tax=Albula goreensis TaxID=1534307 RepID=A0A8T3E7L3_9TELE|nr:hypothetical protein AGOR_G00012080 [Albula goreensis]